MKPLRYAILFTLIVVPLSGCVDDTERFTLGDPALSMLATGNCGRNSAPADVDNPGEIEVVVTGIDPRTPTGNLVSGTRVVLSFANENDALVARFASFDGVGLSAASAELPFNGREARDTVLCTSPRSEPISVIATVTEYIIDEDGEEARTVELVTGPFPVRCLSPVDFNRECSGLPLIDAGVDATVDTGVDATLDAARPPAWSLRFLPPESDSDLEIGIKDSAFGRPDNVLLRFQLVDLNGTSDELGQGLRDYEVNFRLSANPPPNVAIEPSSGRTDENGVVAVRLIAGGTPGVVTVEAEAEIEEGDPLTAQSATVVIRGGIPSSAGFQFLCNDPVISAFSTRTDHNEWQFGIGGQDSTDCTAQLSDRVSGRVDLSTQVFFMTEAGTVTQASVTNEEGEAQTTLRVGPPAPYDTDPAREGYEAQIDQRFADTPYNPRDGLVTVVAVTRGEEEFVDVNGNKVFDDMIDYQLSYMDLAEPCIDVNDDGECTSDLPVRGEDDPQAEVFRDTNRDTIWSEGNGTWDANTEIWKATHVLWAGDFDESMSDIVVECDGMAQCSRNPLTELCNIPSLIRDENTFFLGPGGSLGIRARFNDINGNCLDAYGEGGTGIALNGPIAAADGVTLREFAGECFYESVPTQPVAPYHEYRIMDTTGPMEQNAPKIGIINLSVSYRGVGNVQTTTTLTFRTCR